MSENGMERWTLVKLVRSHWVPNQWVASFKCKIAASREEWTAYFLDADLSREQAQKEAWDQLKREVHTETKSGGDRP